MTKEQLSECLERCGFVKDRFGHYKKTILDGQGRRAVYRYKIQEISVRKEVFSPAFKGWVRLKSGYLSKMSIVGGKISGMVSALR